MFVILLYFSLHIESNSNWAAESFGLFGQKTNFLSFWTRSKQKARQTRFNCCHGNQMNEPFDWPVKTVHHWAWQRVTWVCVCVCSWEVISTKWEGDFQRNWGKEKKENSGMQRELKTNKCHHIYFIYHNDQSDQCWTTQSKSYCKRGFGLFQVREKLAVQVRDAPHGEPDFLCCFASCSGYRTSFIQSADRRRQWIVTNVRCYQRLVNNLNIQRCVFSLA